MSDQTKPRAFTLDNQQTKVLFDLLEEALKARSRDTRLQSLRTLQDYVQHRSS